MTTTIDAAAGPATGVNRFEALQKAAPPPGYPAPGSGGPWRPSSGPVGPT